MIIVFIFSAEKMYSHDSAAVGGHQCDCLHVGQQ